MLGGYLLRAAGQRNYRAGKRNQRFRGSDRSDSPVRRFARRKFQESVRSMVSGVYLAGRDDVEEE